jgi:hypothetical protein
MSMIKYRDTDFHLVQGLFDDHQTCLRMRAWCVDRWGPAVSYNNTTGEWDLLTAGFVFKTESSKIEFMMRWM